MFVSSEAEGSLLALMALNNSYIEMAVDDEKMAGKSLGEDPICTARQMAVVWMKNQLNNDQLKDKVFDYVNKEETPLLTAAMSYQRCPRSPSPLVGKLTLSLQNSVTKV